MTRYGVCKFNLMRNLTEIGNWDGDKRGNKYHIGKESVCLMFIICLKCELSIQLDKTDKWVVEIKRLDWETKFNLLTNYWHFQNCIVRFIPKQKLYEIAE